MQLWKIRVRGGKLIGARASSFKEACEKCGYDWRECYVVAIY